MLVTLGKNGFLHLHAELSDKDLGPGFEPQCLLSGLNGLVMSACMSINLRNELFLKTDQFNDQRSVRTVNVAVKQALENYFQFPISNTKIAKDMHTRAVFLPGFHCLQDMFAPITKYIWEV